VIDTQARRADSAGSVLGALMGPRPVLTLRSRTPGPLAVPTVAMRAGPPRGRPAFCSWRGRTKDPGGKPVFEGG